MREVEADLPLQRTQHRQGTGVRISDPRDLRIMRMVAGRWSRQGPLARRAESSSMTGHSGLQTLMTDWSLTNLPQTENGRKVCLAYLIRELLGGQILGFQMRLLQRRRRAA